MTGNPVVIPQCPKSPVYGKFAHLRSHKRNDPATPVNHSITQSPRQTTTIAWRMSYTQPVTLDTGHETGNHRPEDSSLRLLSLYLLC